MIAALLTGFAASPCMRVALRYCAVVLAVILFLLTLLSEATTSSLLKQANTAAMAGVTAVVTAILFGRPGIALIAGEEFTGFYWAMIILSIAGAVELVGASLESLLISAGKAHVAFLVRLFPTILALVMLESAIGWKGGMLDRPYLSRAQALLAQAGE